MTAVPLRSGRSDRVVHANIRELLRSFMRTGRIGRNRPATPEAACRMAVAIAFRKAGRTRRARAAA